MPAPRLYFDFNATAPLRKQARAAMVAAMDVVGNPSSVHSEGRAARGLLDECRAKVAQFLYADIRYVTFTSGGTEAANLVLSPSLKDNAGRVERLLVSAGEHPCVLEGHRFPADRLTVLPLDAEGRLDLEALKAALAQGQGRPLLALQHANNEIGVVQPLAVAAALVHEAGGLLICDAVQAAGRLAKTALAEGADGVFISAHKLGGPKGVGAVAFARGALHIEEALIRGGGQERGLRSGTENPIAIAGFAAAAEASATSPAELARLAGLRDRIEAAVRGAFPDVVIFGEGAERLPNTSCLAVPGLTAETLLIALDLAGLAISSGSACSSGKVRPSHVLAAMGVGADLAKGALRISLGYSTRESDVESFCETFQKTVSTIRARRGLA
jgi:cysteine desulfurase